MASGTQSPPLEATGSHLPMGVSSIDGTCSKPMKDIEQRAGRSQPVLGVSMSNSCDTDRILQ
ncbi:hypothetical protein J3R83DRAFT_9820 [Lanmaoa asiatica]|nr:hypothetical protein J3R83DRAFT_9820 [Lanmaoa asiatica]